MPLNHYVTLGHSGLRVSPLCLGAMTFGEDWGWGASVRDTEALIDRYTALGGNFLDTANAYTKGHSEKIIGDHIGQHAHKRDRLVLATKFLVNMFPGDPNGGGAHRKNIVSSCEASLRRLRTDYIDLYWMHAWDPHTPIEETMRALDDLVRAGKVRYVGFSDTPAWKCAQAQLLAHMRGFSPLIALQIEYSLLERTVEGELVPMARELGLGITPWAPLKAGVLSGKYRRGQTPEQSGRSAGKQLDERAYKVIDELDAIAKEANSTLSRVAIAWLRSRPGVTSPIVGARTLAQLEDSLEAANLTLSAEQIARLDALTKPTLNFPHDFIQGAKAFSQGGTTINGVSSKVWPLSPQSDAERH
jgi:aryl-alcohol dehydrogenase-like predicted oxidoreductase